MKLKRMILTVFTFFSVAVISVSIAQTTSPPTLEPSEPGNGNDNCSMKTTCGANICSIENAKKESTFSNGCKKTCGYTCTVQVIPMPGK